MVRSALDSSRPSQAAHFFRKLAGFSQESSKPHCIHRIDYGVFIFSSARNCMRFGKALCAWALALAALCSVRPAVAADLIYADQQPQAAQLFESAKANIQVWTLARYFESERIDTFCSIASAAMVLNALGVPAPISRLTYPYNIFEQDNFFTAAVLKIQQVHSVAGK